MSNLSCMVASCSHNDSNQCCLNAIKVEGCQACSCSDTYCGSFNENEMSSGMNACSSPKSTLSISCEVTSCKYNNANKCDADHVDISGIKATNARETVCTTFQAK